ncbi:SipW-dependent-type signal peptide-containing protein [Leifsonia xyli]|uniref:SipW-dependent-type signal peptide-containing protein n=1 Tax=Leifsonia xyli TaxID=1575 RepID=UPI003D671FD6
MTETVPVDRTVRRRRLKALLASGLVLGAGAAVTLAAWNDSEFVTGTFSAGTFNLVGSTDGTSYADHPTAGARATAAFTVNSAALTPGDVTAAPFAVRLAAGTTNDATVTVSAAGTSGTVSELSYQLLQTSSFGCTATTTGTTLVPAGQALGTAPGGITFALTKGAGAAAGAPVYLCFKVTAGANLVQGQTGGATWQFQAASQ